MNTLTSIIIPTFNGLHLLTSCVASIRKHTFTPIEIIIVDNGSTDGTAEYCVHEGLILVSLPTNIGFPSACNRGLKLASGDQIMLLNNDCLASPRWLSNLLTALYSAPEIGMVGPVTNYASGKQQVPISYRSSAEFEQFASLYNQPDASKWMETRRIVGLCLLMKRSTRIAIGLLDERFSPGHFEDDDYCYRAALQGYKMLICGDTFIHHEGSASFKAGHPEGWSDIVNQGRQRFIDKWGVDPHQFIH
ncbi:GT2 family glycosyltransferase [Paenibacillus shirakamiensis]|uniref:GT2 family glycosyltransferase n=1 Tax=Paenibacillus shirakamiensis TaxID=1265935 RepID=A0ABS4JK92_9BACL|nr:glycosyltransferase family 2 protein [Paenibacillus shirakamiensis]MBP2002125.1 GT2 family glycosyltransferase [Paenibacillus shirakamiensis]